MEQEGQWTGGGDQHGDGAGALVFAEHRAVDADAVIDAEVVATILGVIAAENRNAVADSLR